MKKILKGFGIATGIIAITNVLFGLMNVKKAKELHKNYDIAVTFNEDHIDMVGKGSKIDMGVMFAGAEIDYRSCPVLDEPYELNLFNRFSGVEIVVPEEWYVESKGKIAFGGIDNYTVTYEGKEPNLILNFDTSFSGLSIKNERYS